jgi:hypothetical protein
MRIHQHNHFILIGLLTLVSGAMIYIFNRPPTLLSATIGITPSYTSGLFGQFMYNMPTFLHTFSFTLLTVGFGKLRATGSFIAIFFWFSVNIIFETIQYGPIADKIINDTHFKFLANFAQSGTFDFFDLISISLGSLASFFLFMWCYRLMKPESFNK